MESRFYKKVLLLLSIILLLGIALPSFASPYNNKILEAHRNLSNARKVVEVEKYTKDSINFLLKEYNYCKGKGDWQGASEALYGVLSLENKNSLKYSRYQKRLNKAIKNANIKLDDGEYLLNTAWNLNNNGKVYSAKYLLDIYAQNNIQDWKYYEILGDNYFLSSNFKSANEAYLKSLEIRENNKYLNIKLAKTYEMLGENNLALEEYRKILALNDKDTAQEIIRLFGSKLSSNSDNQNHYEILGSAYLILGNPEKTYEYYTKALEIKPDDIFLRYLFAGYLHTIGENESAISMYDSILDTDIYELQIRAGKAKCLKKIGKEKEAIKEYQSILLFYPNSPQAKYGIYEILNGKKKDNEILKAFYPLDKDFDPSPEFIVEFADNILLLDDKNGAERFYTLAYTKNNKNKAVLTALYKYYELVGKQELAGRIVNEAYKLYPNDQNVVNAYANLKKSEIDKKNSLALDYISKKQYKLAIETYLQLDPKDDNTYFSIANCYSMLDDTNSAIQYLNKAIEFNPKNFEAYYALAVINYKKGDLNTSEEMLKKALKIDNKNPSAIVLNRTVIQAQIDRILNEAYVYHEKEDYKKADEVLNNGLRKYPKESQLYYYKGLNKEAMGDILGAIQEYRLATKVDSSCSIAYYSLALLLEKVDNKKGALEAFETYLSHNTNDAERNKYANERVDILSRECY